jgi:hypothetical protein
MGGLVVATLLTLVFLPALYVTWFRIKPPGSGRCEECSATETIAATELAIGPATQGPSRHPRAND